MTHVSLTLPLPPSVNAAYANAPGKGRVKTKAYRRWTAAALAELWQQKPAGGFPAFDGAFSVHIAVPLNMRGDIDNRIKAALDFLKKPACIISDDKHAVGASISRDEKVPAGFCRVVVFDGRAA